MNRLRFGRRDRWGDRRLRSRGLGRPAERHDGDTAFRDGLERYRISSQRTRERDDGILGKGRHRSSIARDEARRGRANPNHWKRISHVMRWRLIRLFPSYVFQYLQSRGRPHGEPGGGILNSASRERFVFVRMELLLECY